MLAYRVNYYSGIIIYAINIGAYYFLWQAIYGDKESLGGLTAEQMTSYIAVAWMARSFYFNNIDREMAMEIKEGKVAIELIRPYSYLLVKMMQGFGEGLFRLLFFSVPGMVLVTFLFSLELPDSLSVWALFFVSIFLSFLINSEINLITGILTFFFLNNEGLMRAKRVIVDLFSGLILPLSFFPGWFQNILSSLPFQGISYLPSMIFSGGIRGSQIYEGLLIQGVWVFLLLIPIFFIWVRARRKLEIQGG